LAVTSPTITPPISPGLLQSGLDHRGELFGMGAGSNFWHHAAIGRVRLNLAGDDVAEDAPVCRHHSGGGLVAAGFNP
jgi:hypothetical protein